MAMSQPRGGSDGDELGEEAVPLSEINVTPLVDVMLVLLIIFMVAAPLMTVGVPVQLPRTAAPKVSQPKQPVVVSIDKDGQPYVDKEALSGAALSARLRALAAEDANRIVLVRGDQGVPYGRVMDVMGQVGAAGFAKISLLSRPPQESSAPAPR
jgi:biopolymer transport protein TolR